MGAGASISDEDELKAAYEAKKGSLSAEQQQQLEAKFEQVKADPKKGKNEFLVIGLMNREFESVCPAAPAEGAAAEAAPAAAAEAAAPEEKPFPRVPEGFEGGAKAGAPVVSVAMTELPAAIEAAIEKDLTPLVLDYSEHHLVETFYEYGSGMTIDAKAMFLRTSKGEKTAAEVLDDNRRKLVNALKFGKTAIVAMSNSAADFVGTFNDGVVEGLDTSDDKAYFPLDVFEAGGKRLMEDEWFNKLNRPNTEEDLPGMDNYNMSDMAKKSFQVVVVSRFSFEDFEEFLFPDGHGLPPGKFQPIWVQHNDGTPANC